MRVLAVVYCLPPLLVPAAVRYLKLLVGLHELGVQVEVLIIDPRSFAAPEPGMHDASLAALLPSEIVRHEVWSPESHPALRLLKRAPLSQRLFYRWLEPRKREWLHAANRRTRTFDWTEYDAVLTCSQPHANHLLGLQLKRRTNLPWIAYFGDPWSQNPYARFASPGIARYHRALEAEVLTQSDFVFFTSEEMARLAQRGFPGMVEGKYGVLPNSYVPEWYSLVANAWERRADVELLHTGHFYGPRTPLPLLQALERLHTSVSLEGKLRIACYGSFPDRERAMLRDMNLDKVVEIHDVVPYLESLSLMHSADGLLLIDAKLTTTQESVFLPSKLVDYLGSERPIVAMTPRQGTSARIVEQSGGIVCDIADANEIESGLHRVVNGALAGSRSDPAVVTPFHYLQVAGHLVEALDRVTSHRRTVRSSS